MIRITVSDRLIDVKTGRSLPPPSTASTPTTLASNRPPQTPEDRVVLSKDAASLMNRAEAPESPAALSVAFDDTAPNDGLESLTRLHPDFDPRKFTPAYMSAERDYLAQMGDYMSKRGAAVKDALGVAISLTGGAGHAVLDRLAEDRGVMKPEPPRVLLDAGWTDPLEADAQSQTGVIGMGIPGNGPSLTIAFDRAAAADAKDLRLVRLTSNGAENGALLSAVKSSPLGKLTEWNGASGASLYAITDGKTGPNARVYATVSSMGMDDEAERVSAPLLQALKRYMTTP